MSSKKLSTYNSLCENASISNNYNLYNFEISHDLGICASSTMHYKLIQKNKKVLETAMVSLQIHLVIYIRSHGH